MTLPAVRVYKAQLEPHPPRSQRVLSPLNATSPSSYCFMVAVLTHSFQMLSGRLHFVSSRPLVHLWPQPRPPSATWSVPADVTSDPLF